MKRFGFAHRPHRRLPSRWAPATFCLLMNRFGSGFRFPTPGAKTSTRCPDPEGTPGAQWGTLPLWGALPFCLLMALTLPVRSQQVTPTSHPTLQQPIGQAVGGDRDDIPQGPTVQDERLLRALNADRQRSMVADANRLLRLAKELNAEIARTNPDSLSLDQLHKMAEIEKLARNVKEKMSTSVRGMPAYQSPMQPLQ
jgi:hypothetical protein